MSHFITCRCANGDAYEISFETCDEQKTVQQLKIQLEQLSGIQRHNIDSIMDATGELLDDDTSISPTSTPAVFVVKKAECNQYELTQLANENWQAQKNEAKSPGDTITGSLQQCLEFLKTHSESDDIINIGIVMKDTPTTYSCPNRQSIFNTLQELNDIAILTIDGMYLMQQGNIADLGEVLQTQAGTLRTLRMFNCRGGPDFAAQIATHLVSKSSTLVELLIGNNPIGATGGRVLADALNSNDSIETLDISKAKLCEIRPGVRDNSGILAICQAIGTVTSLTSLNISTNNIGYDMGSVQALATSIKNCIKLNTLDISHNNIDSNGITTLAEALKEHQSIVELNISANHIGTADAYSRLDGDLSGVIALSESIRILNTLRRLIFGGQGKWEDNVSTLNISDRNVALSNKGLQGSDAIIIGAWISRKDVHIQKVDVSNNFLFYDKSSTTRLVEAITQHTTITELNIAKNEMDTTNENILAGVSQNPGLKRLHFGGNGTYYDNTAHTERGYEPVILTDDMTEADLRNKNLDTGGAKIVSEWILHTNTKNTLMSLDISNNKIGTLMPPDNQKSKCEGQLQPDGIIALVNAIKSTQVTSLDLSNNEIERHGAECLVQLLQTNTHIKQCTLDSNRQIPRDVIQQIDGLISKQVGTSSSRRRTRRYKHSHNRYVQRRYKKKNRTINWFPRRKRVLRNSYKGGKANQFTNSKSRRRKKHTPCGLRIGL